MLFQNQSKNVENQVEMLISKKGWNNVSRLNLKCQ